MTLSITQGDASTSPSRGFPLGLRSVTLIILFGLWRDLLPATDAFLHFRIVTWWVLAVMPEIGLRLWSLPGSAVFFDVYDSRLSLPEPRWRICIIRRRRIAEGAKAKSRAVSERGPSINNRVVAFPVMCVTMVMAMPVRMSIFIPVLSLMIILFAVIIFLAAVIPAVVSSVISASVESTIISVKSCCRSTRDRPEQSDGKARYR